MVDYFSRYTLYINDKLVYGCKTEKGMINHIKKIRPQMLVRDDERFIIADIKNSPDDAIRERMYKVYGLSNIYVERNWMLPHGIDVRRNNDGTVDLIRKVTDHEADGDWSDYKIVDTILLGSFKNVDKVIDYWQQECGRLKSRHDGSGHIINEDDDFWKYTDESIYQYSMDASSPRRAE